MPPTGFSSCVTFFTFSDETRDVKVVDVRRLVLRLDVRVSRRGLELDLRARQGLGRDPTPLDSNRDPPRVRPQRPDHCQEERGEFLVACSGKSCSVVRVHAHCHD